MRGKFGVIIAGLFPRLLSSDRVLSKLISPERLGSCLAVLMLSASLASATHLAGETCVNYLPCLVLAPCLGCKEAR